jgi:hypothetical protein
MSYIFDYLEHYWIAYGSFPFVIRVAIFFIVLSAVTTTILIINTFIVRKIKARNEKIVKEFRPKIFSFLRNVLLSKEEYTPLEVRSLFIENFGSLSKKLYLSIIPTLEDVIMQEHEYVGSANYNSIIRGLKIDSYLEKRLDFSSTRVRLRVFHSLSRLELTISDSKILPHTYADDESLRKESRASYVGVSNNDPFKFFEVDNNINDWDQINLMQQFEQHHKDNLPNFSKWIKYSKNPAQVKFFVKLAAYFNQRTAIAPLTDLLETPNHSVRMEVILALGKMLVKEVEGRFIKMYFTQPLACQNAIIEAISYINSGKALGFLKMAYELANNSDSKKLIAEVIYLYGKQGRALFDSLFKTENGFDLQILKHVENPLIPSALKSYHKHMAFYGSNPDTRKAATEDAQVLMTSQRLRLT